MPADEAQPPALPDNSRRRGSRKPTAKKPAEPVAKALRGFTFESAVTPQARAEKPKREPKPKVKNDPRHIAAARELRDRWLEQVNATPVLSQGKYDVSRQLAARQRKEVLFVPQQVAA